jgi:hypothetical protein
MAKDINMRPNIPISPILLRLPQNDRIDTTFAVPQGLALVVAREGSKTHTDNASGESAETVSILSATP